MHACTGCDNCIWSPIRTMFRTATPIATEFATLTRGDFALALEHFAEHEPEPSWFFYLTEGAHCSHWLYVLHLMQILAILHVNVRQHVALNLTVQSARPAVRLCRGNSCCTGGMQIAQAGGRT